MFVLESTFCVVGLSNNGFGDDVLECFNVTHSPPGFLFASCGPSEYTKSKGYWFDTHLSICVNCAAINEENYWKKNILVGL